MSYSHVAIRIKICVHNTFIPISIACLVVSFLTTPLWGLGILVPRRPDVLPIESGRSEVKVDISNNIARTRIHQEFYNPNPHPLEADFVFPLPPGASVTDFVLYIDGKPHRGEILDREKARNIYEDIVRRMRDPGLLEWADWNLFRVAIFPVPPRGTQQIEIEFGQTLAAEQGTYRYLFPMAGPAHKKVGRGNTPGSVSDNETFPSVKFVITLTADAAIGNVYSPTHKLETKYENDRKVVAELIPTGENDFRENFVFLYDYRDKAVAATLVCHRPNDEPGYFCLMLSPQASEQKYSTTPLDLVLVIDTSGSMAEQNKIEQARRAVRYCLSQLQRGDRFGIVKFSTEVEPYRDKLISATQDEVERAQQWVDRLRATGGTNIADALDAALRLMDEGQTTETKAGRHRLVIFVTDGLPTVGETSVDRIVERVRSKIQDRAIRIFTFGVGNDVNTRLLDSLAEQTRASSEYIGPKEDLEVPVSRLYDKASRPALSNVSLQIKGIEVFDMYPRELADLFYGTQLTVFGRYKTAGPAVIRLTGMLGSEEKEFVFEKTFPEKSTNNDYIPHLWAVRKVGYLLDEMRKHTDNQELRDEIIRLAKEYGIVTPLTSYLVVEDKEGPPPPADHPVLLREPSSRFKAGDMTNARRANHMSPMASAPALRAESGEMAVMAAKTLRQMKESSTASGQKSDSVRWIHGRKFFAQDGVWVESGTEAATDIVRVKAFSPAYFELIRLDKRLKDILALGERVRTRIGNAVIEVGPEGIEELSPELENRLKK